MFTVALIGPDGVGKTTISRQLTDTFPLPLKYIYMGDNVDSGNYMLPTTRWLKKRNRGNGASANLAFKQKQEIKEQKPDSPAWVIPLKYVKKTLGFTNRILDEWYRHLVAYYFKQQGFIVLFDRHFVFDYYHFDIQPTNGKHPFKRRLHGWFLKHTMPQPDLVICLDAPAEVVFERKGEFSIEFLHDRRSQYLNLKNVVPNFEVVDADRKLQKVIKEVGDLIQQYYKKSTSN